jgi:GH24 family phage-related lysozyme (muramidase)
MATWFTILSAHRIRPAAGPWRTESEALSALENFRYRHGHLAGSYLNAGSAVLCVFPTRQAARESDISDWTRGGGRVLRGLVLRREAEAALI